MRVPGTDKMYWRKSGAPRASTRVGRIRAFHSVETSNSRVFVKTWKGFFSNSNNTVEKRQYYFEYNPSIVVLPAE
jgi:hypothetical protein